MKWPWHIKVTRADGTVTENDYTDADGFDAAEFGEAVEAQA